MKTCLLFWAAWAALVALLLQRLVQDALPLLQPSCDTTYLWEGYEELRLGEGPRYRLIKFADGDRNTAAARARTQKQHPEKFVELPVLFVHGHLGSHQQMRSAASETGRELARRAAVDPAGWHMWLQWYAADFNAEASALDSTLLSEQAAFVLRCIEHLRLQHTASAAPASADAAGRQHEQQRKRPFRLVLVAYSMGGLVARQAVRRLADDPYFDMAQLVALVTLGSPEHFPSFMPTTQLADLFSKSGLAVAGSLQNNATSAAGWAAEAAVAATAQQAALRSLPQVNILAGAGDFSLPQTHAGVAAPLSKGAGPGLTLQMRDMPGVWATCSHKAVVSCNQLVRQLVPALVDATQASLDEPRHASLADRHAVAQALLCRRLATNTAAALGMVPATPADALIGGSGPVAQQPAGCAAELAAAGGQPFEQVTAPLLQQSVLRGGALKLRWSSGRAAAAGWHGVLLMATAAPACSHLSIAAVGSNGTTTQLASAAAALPPLLPELRQRWVPRHWQEVMRGLDWQHNATRLLYVPFADPSGSQLSSIDVVVRGSSTGGTSLLAQALASHPAAGGPVGVQLPAPGGTAALPAGHAALLSLRMPHHAWPLDSSVCAAVAPSKSVVGCVTHMLLGATPPWNLRIQQQRCSDADGGSGSVRAAQRVVPAVLALQTGSAAGDSVRVAETTAGGISSGQSEDASAVVQLWSGVDPLDSLLLVSDPRCAYSLRLDWDVGGWLGLALRHLLFILPALCMAASQARLSPLPGSTARVLAAAAVLAAWGSQHPAVVKAALGSGLEVHPWVRLSAVQALAALMVAAGGASVWGRLTRASVGLLQRVLPSKLAKRPRLLGWLGIAGVGASCGLLPAAVPAGLSCLCLALQLAAAASQPKQGDATSHGTRVHSPQSQPPAAWQHQLAWLVFSSQVALLPAVEMLSSLLSGGWQSLHARTTGRALTAVLALHTCMMGCTVSTPRASGAQVRPRMWQEAARGAAHELAACAAAAAALWGQPWLQLPSAVFSALVFAILG